MAAHAANVVVSAIKMMPSPTCNCAKSIAVGLKVKPDTGSGILGCSLTRAVSLSHRLDPDLR